MEKWRSDIINILYKLSRNDCSDFDYNLYIHVENYYSINYKTIYSIIYNLYNISNTNCIYMLGHQPFKNRKKNMFIGTFTKYEYFKPCVMCDLPHTEWYSYGSYEYALDMWLIDPRIPKRKCYISADYPGYILTIHEISTSLFHRFEGWFNEYECDCYFTRRDLYKYLLLERESLKRELIDAYR